jgi:exonuclease III
MIRKTLGGSSQIHKVDKHNRHMWVRLDLGEGRCLFIAGCYIPHKGSTFYDRATDVNKEDPMDDIEQEAATLTSDGEVIILGDFNARTGSRQTDTSPLAATWEKEECIDAAWTRESLDNKGMVDSHGEALLRMCNSTQLVIANGMKRWPNSQRYTCHTASGQSVIDYLLLSERAIENVENFYIKDLQPESDHCPLHVNLKWNMAAMKPSERCQKMAKRIIDYKKAPSYTSMVEARLKRQNDRSWETFQRVIKECAEECF